MPIHDWTRVRANRFHHYRAGGRRRHPAGPSDFSHPRVLRQLSPGSDVRGHLERFPGGAQVAAGSTRGSVRNSVGQAKRQGEKACLLAAVRFRVLSGFAFDPTQTKPALSASARSREFAVRSPGTSRRQQSDLSRRLLGPQNAEGQVHQAEEQKNCRIQARTNCKEGIVRKRQSAESVQARDHRQHQRTADLCDGFSTHADALQFNHLSNHINGTEQNPFTMQTMGRKWTIAQAMSSLSTRAGSTPVSLKSSPCDL